jgi:hypothetical protein
MRRSSSRLQSARCPPLAAAASEVPLTHLYIYRQTPNVFAGFSACIGLLLSAPSNNGTVLLQRMLLLELPLTPAAGQRMAEFIILAATAAMVSMPSRLLSVCLLRYLKDDHLRSGISFSPWPKIIAVCGVSVALAAASSCFLVFMLPGWTSMLLRSHFTRKHKPKASLYISQSRPGDCAVNVCSPADRLLVGSVAFGQPHRLRRQVISRAFFVIPTLVLLIPRALQLRPEPPHRPPAHFEHVGCGSAAGSGHDDCSAHAGVHAGPAVRCSCCL